MKILTLNAKKTSVLALTALYMLVFAVMLVAHPGSEQFYQDFNNIYQIIPPLFAGVCGVALARRQGLHSPQRRTGWFLLGLAALSFTGGQITWTYLETLLRAKEMSSPGTPDIGYSGVKPLFIAGLLLLFSSMPMIGRARLLVDSALTASSVALISWYFIIAPLWQNEAISLAGKVISVMYPVGDVAILFCAIALWGASTSDASLRRSINYLFCGVLLITIADVLYSLSSLNGSYRTGSWFDWAWSFGWLSIAYASLLPLWWPIPSAASGKDSVPLSAFLSSSRWSWIKLLAPYITLTISFVVVVMNNIGTDGSVDVSVLAAASLLMSVVLLRQVLFLLENKKLTEQKEIQEILKKSNEELELRVMERTAELELSNQQLSRASEEAVVAREEAERANLAKSEFLSRMSHELRTPLNAILGFGQILAMRSRVGDREAEAVEHILKGGRHLLDLINEVLDIARVEAGHLDIVLEPIDIAVMVREVLDLVRPLPPQQEIQLVSQVPEQNNWHVLADNQRLRQVLINLLSNAVKYNRAGGRVTVTVRDEGTPEKPLLRISVIDTGAGLSETEVAKLFTPFERLSAAQTQIEGTGIGLVLSKRLIEAMQGKIGVESSVGEGSTFWVELPMVDGLSNRVIYHDTSSGEQAIWGAQQTTRTLLYIEDNLSNLRVIEMLLQEMAGVKLLPAMQGSVGLDMARQHHPDMILLDLHLPDITGEDVLRRLQASPETQDIPVIILSADAMPATIGLLQELGARRYLTKPIDVKQFFSVLEDMLNKENN